MASSTGASSAIDERLAFMSINEETRTALRQLKPLLASSLGPALAVFYDKVRSTPQTRKFFADDGHMKKAKGAQERHWNTIVDAEFGDSYTDAVRAIGKTHARLGLEPRWYVGGYAILVEQLIQAVVEDRWPSLMYRGKERSKGMSTALSSLVKAAFLDMELSVSIYLEELEEKRRQIEAERQVAEQNQARALGALAAALEKVAGGDLRTRLNDELTEEFHNLRDDFNGAVAKLQEALTEVAASTNSIHSAANEIAQASDDMARRTETQAASLEETTAAVKEISAAVNTTASSAKNAANIVAATKKEAEENGGVVRRAVDAMGRIEKSSSSITKIIGAIDEIAFQTNLLALNAGVEAARAGEAGKGFAVVASEVRALAQRATESAKEIKQLIAASSSEVDEGVDLVSQAGKALERIVVQVAEIDKVVVTIASGASEQANALVEVSQAVNQMDLMTQQNAAMVEEATAASASLRNEASSLAEMVAMFNVGETARSKVTGRHDGLNRESTNTTSGRAKKSQPVQMLKTVAGAGGGNAARKASVAPNKDDWEEF